MRAIGFASKEEACNDSYGIRSVTLMSHVLGDGMTGMAYLAPAPLFSYIGLSAGTLSMLMNCGRTQQRPPNTSMLQAYSALVANVARYMYANMVI